MLFLADEVFPGLAVRWLREAGHDVVWARTHMPADADSTLLAAAKRDIRVVYTGDKDFRRWRLSLAIAGIVPNHTIPIHGRRAGQRLK